MSRPARKQETVTACTGTVGYPAAGALPLSPRRAPFAKHPFLSLAGQADAYAAARAGCTAAGPHRDRTDWRSCM